MRQLPQNPLILGSGMAGLAVGWNLAQDGVGFTMIEKEGELGGLTRTFEDDGFYFDLGPHNFHSKYPDILDFVLRLMGDKMLRHYPTVKIIFKGKLITYPLKGINVFTSLPPRLLFPAVLYFVLARVRMFLTDPVKDDTFKDWITNRFGGTLYDIYFGPYAEKAWKIEGSNISDYVAIKRVPVVSIRDHIRRTLGLEQKHRHTESGELPNYYLKYGSGMIPDALIDGAKEEAQMLRNCRPVAIKGKHGRVESVQWQDTAGRTHEKEVDFLFSTIPLPDLIKIMDLDTPDEVKAAAEGLDYCAERLVYVKLKREYKEIPSLLYFSDPEIKFNRLYNVGDWSKDCTPPGKAAVCVEFTCSVGDDVWTLPEDQLCEYAQKTLVGLGVIRSEDVEGFATRKIEHAYPRFRVGFEDRMKVIFDYLSGVRNLITLGRQGLFCYANIDDALHMAFRAYENMNTMNVKNVDYYDLFPKHTTL